MWCFRRDQAMFTQHIIPTASSEPAKVQFVLPTATARSSRSMALLDMHRRPSPLRAQQRHPHRVSAPTLPWTVRHSGLVERQ